ncbi:MAG TPA: beta-ketoacyl synthase chain length factor [Chryseosolibacter sp.]|nr:beta-ketoacyl synthase chain length factor [Chryseosolibacter sp.]
MRLYIDAIGTIAPCQLFGDKLEVPEADGNVLKCIEPDYSAWISPQSIRRMSRILKMGTTSALMAIRQASLTEVDAVITGTGYGCIEDTTSFLTKITELEENALNPTPFMQSTHNTIGSLIALLLQCRGYNQTFVHGSHSFEHALLDAMFVLDEQPALKILIGGVDEWTESSHAIHSRFGKYRRPDIDGSMTLVNESRGAVAGEGASFFAIAGRRSSVSKSMIESIKTFIGPIKAHDVSSFLNDTHVDLVLCGFSGNARIDQEIEKLMAAIFPHAAIGRFKHLCGEFTTASAFAVALASRILANSYNDLASIGYQQHGNPIRTILVYNRYFAESHSLILMRAC